MTLPFGESPLLRAITLSSNGDGIHIHPALSKTNRSASLYINENILPSDLASSSKIAGILTHVFRANEGMSMNAEAKIDDLT
jgi:hypothetical protein